MRRFAELYSELDQSTATLDKRAALAAYFRHVTPADAAWALRLLSGGKIGGAKARIASSSELREWASQRSGIEPWLIDESYSHVGDLAETLTLLMNDPITSSPDISLADWIEKRLLPIANADANVRRDVIVAAWDALHFSERLVFNKLLTGSLRVGVSQRIVQQALAEISGVDIARIAQRMLGDWPPTVTFYQSLLSLESIAEDSSQPFPFFLASQVDDPVSLGDIGAWSLEWKWDGIRLQLIRRDATIALWSRGEERLDGRFPEIERAAASLPHDAVIDGELLAWREGDAPMPFTALQTRIQRKKPGPKSLNDTPVRMLAYDLLELDGEDLRAKPLVERRAALKQLLDEHADPRIVMSHELPASDWDAARALRESARERGVEGIMLKRRDSAYQMGRKRGDWWKWKIDPLTIDAVLIYAQAGHGRRSTLFTDYTFALWHGEELVPVAKAYSGLDDKEILQLDRWIRAHTLERFGPVRSVAPHHVFELGFEAVNRSQRHKSGIAVRFPRILRWRHDKPFAEADRLETLQALAR
ncbi:MAG: ATP-dependent DNA ligase [Rudaea sp.]